MRDGCAAAVTGAHPTWLHMRGVHMCISHATSRMRESNPAVRDSSSRSIVVITRAIDRSKAPSGDKCSATGAKPGMCAMMLRTVEVYAQACCQIFQ